MVGQAGGWFRGAFAGRPPKIGNNLREGAQAELALKLFELRQRLNGFCLNNDGDGTLE
jgi:hypothetical protein